MFFRDDPVAWFLAIESTFFLKGIRNNVMKFHYAVAKLDAETCFAVGEVLWDVNNSSYDDLRNRL